jgi:hypothetical protein
MYKIKVKKIVHELEAWQTDKDLIISTLEGDLNATKGDWIVKGIEGEQYPVKKELFWKLYERAEN